MIALLGANGRIGKRYRAILKYLQQEYVAIEKDDEIFPETWERAIIATPTDTHFEIAEFCEQRGIPYLLEKPATSDLHEAEIMSTWRGGYIVNNYQWLLANANCPQDIKSIQYNYFNTGPDGFKLDLIQLIYMAHRFGADFSASEDSPTWTLYLNDFKVPYEDLELTYVSMVRAFVESDYRRLMPISHALPMLRSIQ